MEILLHGNSHLDPLGPVKEPHPGRNQDIGVPLSPPTLSNARKQLTRCQSALQFGCSKGDSLLEILCIKFSKKLVDSHKGQFKTVRHIRPSNVATLENQTNVNKEALHSTISRAIVHVLPHPLQRLWTLPAPPLFQGGPHRRSQVNLSCFSSFQRFTKSWPTAHCLGFEPKNRFGNHFSLPISWCTLLSHFFSFLGSFFPF